MEEITLYGPIMHFKGSKLTKALELLDLFDVIYCEVSLYNSLSTFSSDPPKNIDPSCKDSALNSSRV